MADNEKAKADRDPIFTFCLIAFVIAVIAIGGAYVYDHYIESDDSVVNYGSTVEVTYTGTFYDYVGEDIAVVFDTNDKKIGNDDDYVKSNSYTAKTTYSEFSVTVGSGKALKMFEDALVGHGVGDVVKVAIPAGEGYVSPSQPQWRQLSNDKISTQEIMSKTTFSALYKDVTLTTGVMSSVFTSVYGWDAQAYMSTDQIVIVTYNPEVKVYDYQGNEDSKFGKLQFDVKSVNNGVITFDWKFTDTTTTVGDEIQMLKLDFGGEHVWYVTEIGSESFGYKTCGETYNVELFFTIKIDSIA